MMQGTNLMQSVAGLSVSQLNDHIKDIFDADELLHDVWVQGEVSRLTKASSGHVYFTLKDDRSAISCVMWRTTAGRLGWLPDHGDAVLIRGAVSVYTVQGAYQLYVNEMQPLGAGRLHLEFEALKERLAAEGLFDPARKRSLPTYPRSIGVVTSPTAAAFADILRVLGQRYPLARVVLSPTLVQGESAPAQIVAAIQALNAQRELAEIDVIIVARGGGSLEELWAFNDERVARAIAGSNLPVIAGIGHEIDFTIADFVADYRAPTPTGAAAAAVPDGVELRLTVDALSMRLQGALGDRLERERQWLDGQLGRLLRAAPRARLARERQRVDDLSRRAARVMAHRLQFMREQVAAQQARLRGLDPRAVLERGYAIVSRRDSGATLSRVGQAESGLELDVRVRDGSFGVVIE
jgi:exodeoxyribonuclease VII large subunit